MNCVEVAPSHLQARLGPPMRKTTTPPKPWPSSPPRRPRPLLPYPRPRRPLSRIRCPGCRSVPPPPALGIHRTTSPHAQTLHRLLASFPALERLPLSETSVVPCMYSMYNAYEPWRSHQTGSWDNTIRIWDATTGALIVGPLKEHGGPILSMVLSPDGKRLVTSSGLNIRVRRGRDVPGRTGGMIMATRSEEESLPPQFGTPSA
ncbi:hypothetical protein FIBSPDRAFT_1042345 [Athelia psychrophila]|uniref:Uncharacterized protein n=1 Tax=Athelia psychrophila TaxID=1759441 RepID=A0A166MTY3_9AGAM|nr:hypothetical protein FIBSPDRAFT_1042345 [Fibularhizoctonia sp. CBS 109695]